MQIHVHEETPDDLHFILPHRRDELAGAEELIYALCQVEGLRVVSRVSAFEFKGKSQNLAQIARELNVTSVLNGSVRRAGDRLRINVELTNVADGFCLWSERFDREMKDVFAISGRDRFQCRQDSEAEAGGSGDCALHAALHRASRGI
jgi:hypothetical protein